MNSILLLYMVNCTHCEKEIPEGEYVYDGKDENGNTKWAPYQTSYYKDGKEIVIYLCDDCKDLSVCEECGEIFEYDELTEISPIWQHTRKNAPYQSVMVCKDCADEYSVCEECGAVGLWGEKCDCGCECENCMEDGDYDGPDPDDAYESMRLGEW